MKTSELIGPALDWAVAKCEGLAPNVVQQMSGCFIAYTVNGGCSWIVLSPSTDWSQGGPISEREEIGAAKLLGVWTAALNGPNYKEYYGPTELIAKMRCYVASKLGDEVEIPEELK